MYLPSILIFKYTTHILDQVPALTYLWGDDLT